MVNDVPEGHYGDAIPALREVSTTVAKVLGLPEPPRQPVAVCDRPYPASMEDLRDTLLAWGGSSTPAWVPRPDAVRDSRSRSGPRPRRRTTAGGCGSSPRTLQGR